MNQELPDIQVNLEKAEELEVKHPLDHGKNKRIKKKKRKKNKTTSASLTMLKPLTVCIRKNWKILQEMGILDHITCLQ